MRTQTLLQIAILAVWTTSILSPGAAIAALRAGDTVLIEYLDGRTATVEVSHISSKYLFVRTHDGGYTVLAQDLSDKTLRDLGMTYVLGERQAGRRQEELRRKREEEELSYARMKKAKQEECERQQKKKGLIQFRGSWVTPTQQQEMLKPVEATAHEGAYIPKADSGMHFTMDVPYKGTKNKWVEKHSDPLVVVLAPQAVQISLQTSVTAPFAPKAPKSFQYLSVHLVPKKYEGSVLSIAKRMTTGIRLFDKRYKASTPAPVTVSGEPSACFHETLTIGDFPAKGIAFLVPCTRGYYLLTFRADPASYNELLYRNTVRSFRVAERYP